MAPGTWQRLRKSLWDVCWMNQRWMPTVPYTTIKGKTVNAFKKCTVLYEYRIFLKAPWYTRQCLYVNFLKNGLDESHHGSEGSEEVRRIFPEEVSWYDWETFNWRFDFSKGRVKWETYSKLTSVLPPLCPYNCENSFSHTLNNIHLLFTMCKPLAVPRSCSIAHDTGGAWPFL